MMPQLNNNCTFKADVNNISPTSWIYQGETAANPALG